MNILHMYFKYLQVIMRAIITTIKTIKLYEDIS
jgi:hypothetical protein